MSWHPNGQQQYHNAAQPPPQNRYPSNYARSPPGFDNGDDAYSPNGGAEDAYGHSRSIMGRASSIAARQDHELFMGGSGQPAALPARASTTSRYSQHQSQMSPTTPTYNPMNYAPSIAQPDPQAYGGAYSRTSPPQAPEPYNPARYAEASQTSPTRQSISGGYPYGYSPTAATASFPSPTLQSQPQFSRTSSHHSYGHGQRPHEPAYGLPQSPGSAPPPQPSAYVPPPPPALPVPPGGSPSQEGWSQPPPSARPLPPAHGSAHYPHRGSDTSLQRFNTLPSPPPHQSHRQSHGYGYPEEGRFEPYSGTTHARNPLPSPPAPLPPPHDFQRTPSDGGRAHTRPLPPPPEHSSVNGYEDPEQQTLYNELFDNLTGPRLSPRIEVTQQRPVNGGEQQPPSYARPASGTPGADLNGHLSPGARQPSPHGYNSESDLEAIAGVEMMRLAEQEEAANEQRRRTGGTALFASHTSERPLRPEPGSDSDFVGVDVSTFDATFNPPSFHYGGEPNQLAHPHAEVMESRSQPVSSSGSMRRSETSEGTTAYDWEGDSIHPFPPFAARVDTSGTGGLEEPSAMQRRGSYSVGDDSEYTDSAPPSALDIPDLSFYPPVSTQPTGRALPPPPANEARFSQQYSPTAHRGSYPSRPNSVCPPAAGPPRSISLLQHSTTPREMQPMRSKTDAEERLKLRQNRYSALPSGETTGTMTPSSTGTGAVALDLPTLPTGKRFNPQKLTPRDFERCSEPWALSSIISWLKSLAESEPYLKEKAISEGLVALFTYKVPTLNVADAEVLGLRVVQEMYRAGTLFHDEEWLRFGPGTMTGVIYQLTGSGCYSQRLHDSAMSGRCYAHHCQRTLKKINLQAQSSVPQSDDWATFYRLKKEDVEGFDKKEIERQNVLHEIVVKEEKYMQDLDVVRILYRDGLISVHTPIIPPGKLKSFMRDVFGKIDAVKQANEEHLLPQLKYRQQEQGPWITGFSSIFREWIRKARSAYVDYAKSYPLAEFVVRREAARNMHFQTYLDKAQSHQMSNRLGWDTYLKAPITKLQRYSFLLETVLKKSITENEEKKNLLTAIKEIKDVTQECDNQVAIQTEKVALKDLQTRLIIRPGMKVELNLEHIGRVLIYRGDLQRQGSNKFSWLDIHALLFDHYLVLAKTVHTKEGDSSKKHERYDVSRLPIPMDLLVLESTDDDPVLKSSVKGITTISGGAAKVTSVPESRVVRSGSNQGPMPGALTHSTTSASLNTLNSQSSGKTMVATTTLDVPRDEKIIYPLRIKHLGKEVYTLYAPSAASRAEWCDKIIEAKNRHAQALFAQNAEPFRLRVIADSAFGYETGASAGPKSVIIRGTPLDRAIQDVEKMFVNTGRPTPICRAKVNCATAFSLPYGKQMVAVGTEIGVFISEVDNPRGWSRAIQTPRVTQIAVLEEFSLFVLIADRALIAYHLDVVCPASGGPSGNESARKAPQKLSGARDVGFFATGKMKDRTLVFYKKRDGLNSTFKVLEPVFQKSSEKKSRLFRSGRTEFFRDFDEFYIPTECYGVNLFHTSLAVSTSKGFEVLTLDKKQPWSVPDLKAPHVASIASRLTGQSCLGMFRLSDQEFLLCYEECAVYVNKHGDISRSVVMEFVGKAKSAAMYGPYVLLFDTDFVEIRNAENGRLRQVIAGRDVKCLDDALAGGSAGHRTIKLCLQHPEAEKYQIVVELLLNQGLKE